MTGRRMAGSRRCLTLSLDFDGVLCDTRSPWAGAHVIPDPPVSGAIEFLRTKLQDPDRWSIVIFSCRNWDHDAPPGQEDRGILAMRDWLLEHGVPAAELARIDFPLTKPIAEVYLDDRAARFEGVFPPDAVLEDLRRPWNKK